MSNFLQACILLVLGACMPAVARTQARPPVRIAVLAPLYLDSAFSGYSYVKPLSYLPRYMQPGLDFYQGVMAAADSFQRRGPAPEIIVYDTKNSSQSIQQIMGAITAGKCRLIIASLTNPTEQAAVSSAAFAANIPVISATYPNDVNVTLNPFYVVLNPTLHTHIQALFYEARARHPGKPMLLITQPGSAEEIIKTEFVKLARKTGQRYREIVLPEQAAGTVLTQALDTLTSANLVFCASLSAAFAHNVARAVQASEANTILLGMPSWDQEEKLARLPPRIQVWFTSGFQPQGARMARPAQVYRSRYLARSSEAYLRGYESLYRFGNLLYLYGDSMIYKLNDARYPAINEYRIEPNDDSIPGVPDFQENTRIFFTRYNAAAPAKPVETAPAANTAPKPSAAKPTVAPPAKTLAPAPVKTLAPAPKPAPIIPSKKPAATKNR